MEDLIPAQGVGSLLIPYLTLMKKTVFLVFVVFHFFVIISTNIYSTWESFYGVYAPGEEKNSVVYPLLESVALSFPVAGYGAYAGTNTGYGFYAPNVGSQFIMGFEVYDISCKMLVKRMYPHFMNTESVLRFSLCTALMREKLSRERNNEGLEKFMKLMLHQISMYIKKDLPAAHSVRARVYLYTYPPIGDFLNGKEEQSILVDEYTFE